MKSPVCLLALTSILWLGACASDKKPAPASRTSGAIEIDKSIINPTTPSSDPIGTPPITPEDAK